MLHRFRSEAVNMVQAHCAVGGGGRAEVLEVCAGIIVKLCAYPPIEALYVRYVFHYLHAYGGA